MIRINGQELIDANFIGIPYLQKGTTFDGADETGLLRLWLTGQRINFPEVSDGWWNDPKELRKILEISEIVPLKIISKNDILFFTEPGTREAAHIGVAVNNGWFLHMMEKTSKVTQFNKKWIARYGMALRVGGI